MNESSLTAYLSSEVAALRALVEDMEEALALEEDLEHHVLIPHGETRYPVFPRDFNGIRSALEKLDIEGIVWHHPDGRMVKIRKKDFGLSRRPS